MKIKISIRYITIAGVLHDVEVFVNQKGKARLEISKFVNRTLVLLPSISSVSPSSGSLLGGTNLTIQVLKHIAQAWFLEFLTILLGYSAVFVLKK